MELDLTYLPQEDRMRLSIRGQADWLLTRNLLVKLIPAWIDKLLSVDLPDIGIPLGSRDLSQEHALSLEFDGPKNTSFKPAKASIDTLLFEIKLTVDAFGSKLQLLGDVRTSQFDLTRKESHSLLEMLTQKARIVGWLDATYLPDWLGTTS